MTKNLHNKIETGDRLISWAWRLEYVFVSLGLLVASAWQLQELLVMEVLVILHS